MSSLSIAPAGEVVRIQKRPVPTPNITYSSAMAKEERAEYIALCDRLGITDCTDLTRERMRACLKEENIHAYRYADVVKYLDQELGDDWEWRGVRQADVEHLRGCYLETGNRRVLFAEEPYRGAIPLPVLLTMEKVINAVPNVYFYVSTPKGKDGDPFLMVINRWLSAYVIERWDEPGFRERTSSDKE